LKKKNKLTKRKKDGEPLAWEPKRTRRPPWERSASGCKKMDKPQPTAIFAAVNGGGVTTPFKGEDSPEGDSVKNKGKATATSEKNRTDKQGKVGTNKTKRS